MFTGPNIVTEGLVLALDAGNKKSYSGSGNTWYDLSGNGNNGILVNDPSFSSINNGAIQVDGTNDYISVSGMPITNTWSLLIWSLIDGPTSFLATGHRTYASTDNFRFQWDDDSGVNTARGPFTGFVSPGGTLLPSNFNSRAPNDIFNKWNLVTMTCDGNVVTLYYNTVKGSETTSARVFSTNGTMRIGIDGLSGIGGIDIFNKDNGNCFFGPISVYNRALTPQEIQQNYNATKSRFGLT